VQRKAVSLPLHWLSVISTTDTSILCMLVVYGVTLAVWHSVNIVGRINEVTLC